MENEAIEKTEVNTTNEEEIKETNEKVGVAEDAKNDKELSWEKIAAEIAETERNDEVETVISEVNESAHEEVDTTTKSSETEDNSTQKLPEDGTSKPSEDDVIESVEITEMKGEETPETTNEEIEYQVVEAEEVEETNEIIEEHLAQSSSNGKGVTETVVIINPDQSQTEITIEQVEEEEDDDEENDKSNEENYSEAIYLVKEESEDDPAPKKDEKVVKPKKPRGRKPISDIPLHVLGRDISKPIEGVSNGGRTMPKPRLGVKVPYKNLTSQIVSKQEIEKEIMERYKMKQEQNISNSVDLMFTRRLTQRLAQKLIPNEKEKKELINEPTTSNNNNNTKEKTTTSSDIKNNSDLLAILEGDGDDVKEVKKSEREIALEQLKELPMKSPERKAPSSNEKPKLKSVAAPSSELEPRLRTGMVIKTYTRKRKSTDIEAILTPKKTPSNVPAIKQEDNNVYVTKSSRIIKRKVIWDPDETPNKSPPMKSPKLETEIVKTKTPSPVKKIISSPKKPKRLTEVDKLLMDEGAVNMLYDVKTNDETKKKTNKSVISLDKAHKELISKTNVIKNDLQQNTNVQKTLRKKEIVSPNSKKKDLATTPSRKKSKDSTKSTPPASPSFNLPEASRIIRRHSSSSFSSNDELENDEPKKKVEKKKPKKQELKNDSITNPTYKNFTVLKKNHLGTIKFHNIDGKCFLNLEILKELIACLNEFADDVECYVVSIISDSVNSFCHGLDYSLLIVDDEVTRKKKANELANLVKEFLRCLLKFPKILVAGIQGECIGLGVTMLPLFDMVVASDTSTFSTPYTKLGSVPEAGFLLAVPFLSNNGLASELLYTSQLIKADDAFRRGLVSRLCWPEKYQQELKNLLAQISSQPVESLVATKRQLRENILSTESSLTSMSKILVEYWTSEICQKNFAK